MIEAWLDLRRGAVDALASILAALVCRALLDAFLDAEHLPQSDRIQNKQPDEDSKFHLTDLHNRALFVEAISPAGEGSLGAGDALALASSGFDAVEESQRCAAVVVRLNAGVSAISASEIDAFHS